MKDWITASILSVYVKLFSALDAYIKYSLLWQHSKHGQIYCQYINEISIAHSLNPHP